MNPTDLVLKVVFPAPGKGQHSPKSPMRQCPWRRGRRNYRPPQLLHPVVRTQVLFLLFL